MEETKSKLTLGRKGCHWVSFSSFMAQPEGRPKPTLFKELKNNAQPIVMLPGRNRRQIGEPLQL